MADTPADNQSEEFRTVEATDEVEYVREVSGGRICVGLRRHAQVYFLHREERNSEEYSRMLREASESGRPIRLTFEEHTGRIAGVAWAAAEDR
jgi:hypothetical protein